MSNPSRVQAPILEQMAEGETIRVGMFGGLSIGRRRGGQITRVLPQTVSALLSNRWVSYDPKGGSYGAYRITDLGRQAIGAATAGGDDGRER